MYAENPGAFLGLGASAGPVVRRVVLVFVAGAILAGIATHVWRSNRLPCAQAVGFALILGGGIANLGERAAHGFVRDFVQLRLGPVRTGIFNAADLAITTGVVVLVLCWIREVRRTRRAA
jgi:signal peptidase II